MKRFAPFDFTLDAWTVVARLLTLGMLGAIAFVCFKTGLVHKVLGH